MSKIRQLVDLRHDQLRRAVQRLHGARARIEELEGLRLEMFGRARNSTTTRGASTFSVESHECAAIDARLAQAHAEAERLAEDVESGQLKLRQAERVAQRQEQDTRDQVRRRELRENNNRPARRGKGALVLLCLVVLVSCRRQPAKPPKRKPDPVREEKPACAPEVGTQEERELLKKLRERHRVLVAREAEMRRQSIARQRKRGHDVGQTERQAGQALRHKQDQRRIERLRHDLQACRLQSAEPNTAKAADGKAASPRTAQVKRSPVPDPATLMAQMKPRKAAAVLANLPAKQAAKILAGIDARRSSEILAAAKPEVAGAAVAELQRLRAAQPDPGPAPGPAPDNAGGRASAAKGAKP